MATIGKAFAFRVGWGSPLHTEEFEFILGSDGWTVGDIRCQEECGPSGPTSLPNPSGMERLTLPESVKSELSSLHARHSEVSDRVLQMWLSHIGAEMSDRLQELAS
jgi:hypothetical protein